MKTSTFQVPQHVNEETKDYLKGSVERKQVIETYNSMYSEKIHIPLYIGNKEIFTDQRKNITPPHDHQKVVGTYSICEPVHVENAIKSALEIKNEWTTNVRIMLSMVEVI